MKVKDNVAHRERELETEGVKEEAIERGKGCMERLINRQVERDRQTERQIDTQMAPYLFHIGVARDYNFHQTFLLWYMISFFRVPFYYSLYFFKATWGISFHINQKDWAHFQGFRVL